MRFLPHLRKIAGSLLVFEIRVGAIRSCRLSHVVGMASHLLSNCGLGFSWCSFGLSNGSIETEAILKCFLLVLAFRRGFTSRNIYSSFRLRDILRYLLRTPINRRGLAFVRIL